MEAPIGLVLLAAGAATRMGTLKQLLPIGGRSLLRHAAEAAVASGLAPVVVVLGAEAAILQKELGGLDIEVAVNAEWERGMGSSIRAGIRQLQFLSPTSPGVVFTLVDQPLVGPGVICDLVASFQRTNRPIVASVYSETMGVPAFFARSYFDRLASLADQEGAKRVIAEAGDQVHGAPFPNAAYVIDTPEDYQRLRAREADHFAPSAAS